MNMLSNSITTTTTNHEVTPMTNLTAPQVATPSPQVATPSIASSAMLVELSISRWTAMKLDKRASSDVTSQNYAQKGAARVNKSLLGGCAELDAIKKLTGNVRNMHYAMTMPWSDTGLRLLPTTQYFKYHQAMTEMQAEFNRMVTDFLDAYDWEISQAQATLGALFNRDEYPTRDKLISKFGFRLSYIPLPDAGDFRIDVGTEATEKLRLEYDTFYRNQLESALTDVWQRTYDALSRMSERLDWNDGKKIFRDSLVENLTDMVEMLRACNVTGDTQMTAMADQLDTALRGVTPEGLRTNESARIRTKAAVDKAIANLPSLDI